jgi:hypothetical protein
MYDHNSVGLLVACGCMWGGAHRGVSEGYKHEIGFWKDESPVVINVPPRNVDSRWAPLRFSSSCWISVRKYLTGVTWAIGEKKKYLFDESTGDLCWLTDEGFWGSRPLPLMRRDMEILIMKRKRSPKVKKRQKNAVRNVDGLPCAVYDFMRTPRKWRARKTINFRTPHGSYCRRAPD